MPLFEKAPAQVDALVKQTMEKYHQPLRDAGVTIDTLFAKAKTDEFGETDQCALKFQGYPAKAVVKINAYKPRVCGHGDAEIVIDGDRWDEWSEEERAALIDHELEHLELKTDKDGNGIRDDLDRPKLRLRRHDHQFGWFDSVARRHGAASGEVQQAKQFFEGALQQNWLPFIDADVISMKSFGKEATKKRAKAAASAG